MSDRDELIEQAAWALHDYLTPHPDLGTDGPGPLGVCSECERIAQPIADAGLLRTPPQRITFPAPISDEDAEEFIAAFNDARARTRPAVKLLRPMLHTNPPDAKAQIIATQRRALDPTKDDDET